MTSQDRTDRGARSKVLITGAAGYLGRCLLRRLAERPDLSILATDLHMPSDLVPPGVDAADLDVTNADGTHLDSIFARFRPDVVIHLAAMVDAAADRQLAFRVDVEGTRNVAVACLEHGARRLVMTSSGAAYGYHADHPRFLDEDAPLRAEEAFAYAWHKRQVEEDLARLRTRAPQLEQVILRPGTVLGRGVRTPVTRLFEGPVLLGVKGGDDRFVFLWDEDAAGALEHALCGPPGVYNLAGDGTLSMAEIAQRLGSRLLRLPAGVLRTGLATGKKLRLTRLGPEHVRFLQYRPVLDNRRLKEVFGYQPQKSSAEAFDVYAAGRRP